MGGGRNIIPELFDEKEPIFAKSLCCQTMPLAYSAVLQLWANHSSPVCRHSY